MELAVVRFEGLGGAESEYGTVHKRVGDAPWTQEVAFLEHHHKDRISLLGTVAGHYVSADETDHLSEAGAVVGGLVGALLWVALGPAGMAAGFASGGTLGAELGTADETEAEPVALMDALHSAVPKGSSAIVLLGEPSHVDDMLAALGEAGDAVVRRTLSDAELAAIEEALRDSPQASPRA
jgi:uncharacterized membrane protein